MRVEPRILVEHLSPPCTRMLEAAVGLGCRAAHREVGVDHMLLAMLEHEGADVERILRHFEIDSSRLCARLKRDLAKIRPHTASARPVFADGLFRWFSDAWMTASLELGARELRSGHLLLELSAAPLRHLGAPVDELRALSRAELRREFDSITRDSKEAPRAVSPAATSDTSDAQPVDEELARYTLSLTDAARAGELDPVFGRDHEIRQLIEILSRRRKSNPVIVGEPGVGKTALVEGLARAIVNGDVPARLHSIDLRSLDLGQLQAGAGVRGEFERRLKAVIAAVAKSPTPIVLFIDEAHTLVGANREHDAANLLKPALARGELRAIAATTWAEFKRYVEKDAALERRFQPVHVKAPSPEVALSMLRGLREVYERAHDVTIRDEALVAAVTLSDRYICGRQLPDKAIDVIDSAAARVQLEQQTRPFELATAESELEAVTRELEAVTRERDCGSPVDPGTLEALARRQAHAQDRVETLRERWATERAAVERLRANATAARDADDEDARRRAARALTEARDEHREATGGEPLTAAEVDAFAVARAVSSWTGVPVGEMRTRTVDAVLELESKLHERIKGQAAATRIVTDTLRVATAGIQPPDAPLGVLLFVGPSGVGKTEMARALADTLFGDERSLITISMSEYQEKHTISRLVGSPPGYVGYGEGGVLTEAIRQRPYSVLLLDECEKADLEVMNLFYRVFAAGRLADGEGREINFRNTVIILTSNLASDELLAAYRDGEPVEHDALVAKIQPTLARHFKPALLARMTVVPFAPLPPETLGHIARLKLDELRERVAATYNIELSYSDTLVEALAARCHDIESGARNLDHILRSSLMPAISNALLERTAARLELSDLALDLDQARGEWSLQFTSSPGAES